MNVKLAKDINSKIKKLNPSTRDFAVNFLKFLEEDPDNALKAHLLNPIRKIQGKNFHFLKITSSLRFVVAFKYDIYDELKRDDNEVYIVDLLEWR